MGFTRFNAAPLIKLKKAPRQIAQRILGELEVRDLIKHAKTGRDRLMLQVAYFGGLRVSELSPGRACAYTLVVFRSAWPSVADTSVIGAPLSIACDACACRNQCTDAAGLTPARLAASLMM